MPEFRARRSNVAEQAPRDHNDAETEEGLDLVAQVEPFLVNMLKRPSQIP